MPCARLADSGVGPVEYQVSRLVLVEEEKVDVHSVGGVDEFVWDDVLVLALPYYHLNVLVAPKVQGGRSRMSLHQLHEAAVGVRLDADIGVDVPRDEAAGSVGAQ